MFSETLFHQLKAGALLSIEGPFGNFHYRDGPQPLLLVAGGTGLAPLKSIWRHVLENRIGRRMVVYAGARARRDLYEHEVLTRLAERGDELGYIPVLSEPDADWQGRTGFVPQADIMLTTLTVRDVLVHAARTRLPRDMADDKKLERVDGTHPVVHPAAGSHANFYGESLYLGSSASEGVGCDDTRGPTFDVRPVVRTIPSNAGQAASEYPWITFEGRWGELRPAFFNGPTGPNLKEQWTEPITWADGWRARSYTVPGGSIFGTNAADFFCGAVGASLRKVTK